jgi:hypothetical protein
MSNVIARGSQTVPAALAVAPCQLFPDGLHAYVPFPLPAGGGAVVFRKVCPCSAAVDSATVPAAQLAAPLPAGVASAPLRRPPGGSRAPAAPGIAVATQAELDAVAR